MRCAVEIAPIRASPRIDAEQVSEALLHEPLIVEEWADGWVRVRTSYDYRGWMLRSALERGNGTFAAPSRMPPVGVAATYLGAPYLWGGLTERGIDCSGLVHISYRLTGRLIPRDAWQQEAIGTQISALKLRAGDLVTYGDNGRADHIAFWLGDRLVLHATGRENRGVVRELEPEELRLSRRRFIRI